jgi:hypothetical protein
VVSLIRHWSRVAIGTALPALSSDSRGRLEDRALISRAGVARSPVLLRCGSVRHHLIGRFAQDLVPHRRRADETVAGATVLCYTMCAQTKVHPYGGPRNRDQAHRGLLLFDQRCSRFVRRGANPSNDGVFVRDRFAEDELEGFWRK